MKHHANRKDISLYIDGALKTDKREALRAHFADCPLCKKGLEQAESLKASLFNLSSIEESFDFDKKFETALKERISEAKKGLFDKSADNLSRFFDAIRMPIPVFIRVAASFVLIVSAAFALRSYAMEKMPVVEFSAGNARIYRQQRVDRQLAAKPGLRLIPGDKIELKEGAVLNFASRGMYKARVKGNALIVISKLKTGLRAVETDFSLSYGKMLVNTSDKFKGSGMRICTPACEAEVVGTAFLVDVSDKNTWLGVLEGRVKIVSKPHPLKKDIVKPSESFVSSGQGVSTMLYCNTTAPKLLSDRQWQSMLELYQLVEDPQVILLVGTGVDRVNALLGAPAHVFIPQDIKGLMPKELIELINSISEYSQAGNYEELKSKSENLLRIVEQSPNPLYQTQILMFIASHFYYAKDYESALKVLEKVAGDYPESEMASLALCGMASIYQNDMKDIKMARQIYAGLIKAYPDSPDAVRARDMISLSK